MNIYTKTGDKGETSLYGGTRVSKDDKRVWCYGTVDEANSILGVIYASLGSAELKEVVRLIQKKMFVIGAQLASDEKGRDKLGDVITDSDIAWLEEIIDHYSISFGKSAGFVIPGETPVSSLFHVARTVVRRAERHLVELAREDFVSLMVLQYINRLSDALFVLAKREIIDGFIKKVAERIYRIVAEEEKKIMTEKLCVKLCDAAYAESNRIGVPICFTISDARGTLLYFSRQEGALAVSIGISQKKAYTAAVLRMPTAELGAQSQPGCPLYGINTVDDQLVLFGGGFPLLTNGDVVGAIGISGGSVEQDEQIGRVVLAAFQKHIDEGGGGIA